MSKIAVTIVHTYVWMCKKVFIKMSYKTVISLKSHSSTVLNRIDLTNSFWEGGFPVKKYDHLNSYIRTYTYKTFIDKCKCTTKLYFCYLTTRRNVFSHFVY